MNVNAFKFRKKPVVIEAYQWKDGDALNLRRNGWPQWLVDAVHCDENWGPIVTPSFEGYATIKTLEGEMRAESGDWIIRGVKGELYPCKPDIFAATYLPVDEDGESVYLTQLPDGSERLTFLTEASGFSDALTWLKEGKRVQRAGWNGKGLWLEYVAPRTSVDLPFIQLIYPVPGDGSLPYPNGARVPWAPSQTDMLADDWRVVS